MHVKPLTLPERSSLKTLGALFDLAKPRITLLLLIVALVSYFICGGSWTEGGLWKTLLAVLSLSIGIFTLNQWMERDEDTKMMRTRDRPLPAGRISPSFALVWGLGITLVSLGFSFFALGLLMGLVAVFTAIGYLLVYTPLKYRTVFHTALGALPGATPPLAGALGATGHLDLLAWALFGVLFFWQFPHFLAIEMIYRDDYARSGTQVLPVLDARGFWTGFQVVVGILGAGLCGALGVFLVSGTWITGALLGLGTLGFLALGIRAVVTQKKMASKHLLRASVLYLPLVLIFLSFRW